MQIPDASPTSGGFVTSACSCNAVLTFTSFDEEDEQVRVPCSTCGQVWLVKRADQGWIKLPLGETIQAGG